MSAGTDYHQNDPLIKSRTCQYLRHRPMVNVIDILRPQNINRYVSLSKLFDYGAKSDNLDRQGPMCQRCAALLS